MGMRKLPYAFTEQGVAILKSQIAISKPAETRGGTQKLPYAFTELGIWRCIPPTPCPQHTDVGGTFCVPKC